uniref:Uncharacterized protein n=1 Tax=Panagrolaimus superbus TaxID=310955 RepID=A0A914XWT0_9BILA
MPSSNLSPKESPSTTTTITTTKRSSESADTSSEGSTPPPSKKHQHPRRSPPSYETKPNNFLNLQPPTSASAATSTVTGTPLFPQLQYPPNGFPPTLNPFMYHTLLRFPPNFNFL